MRKSPAFVAGAVLAGATVLLAAFAPVVAPHDPAATDEAHRFAAPSFDYPFGTDQLGRCVLSRVLYGARISLLLTVGVVAGGSLLGTVLGGVASALGGIADLLLVGLVDLVLSLPRLVLALVAVGLAGPSIPALVAVLVLVDWTGSARVSRSVVLKEKALPYILAERALGLRRARIVFRSLLPATVSPVLVYSVLRMGGVLLAIAGLGFLGLGVQPPVPEWGAMIGEGRVYLRSAPWIALFPGLVMVVTVFGFSLLSEGLEGRAAARLLRRTVR